jgi:hypothetical protein
MFSKMKYNQSINLTGNSRALKRWAILGWQAISPLGWSPGSWR